VGVDVVAVGGVSSRGFEDAGMWVAWEEGHLWLGMVEWWKVLRQLIDISKMALAKSLSSLEKSSCLLRRHLYSQLGRVMEGTLIGLQRMEQGINMSRHFCMR
jgi:hypothetical protein